MVKRDIDTFLGCNFFVRGTIEFIKQPEDDGSVIILAGQSNAGGSGWPGYLSPPHSEPFEPVKLISQRGCRSSYPIVCTAEPDGWTPLAPRESAFGAEIMMGHNLHAAGWDNLHILQAATGGTDLWRSWHPDATTHRQLYRRMMEVYNEFCVDGQTVKGFVWIQGERDALEDDWSLEYEDNLLVLFERVREDFGENLPIVYLRLHAEANYEFRDRVRAAQEAVEPTHPANYMINADDLDLASDGMHYNSSGYVGMGERCAEKLIEHWEGQPLT